MFKVVTVCLAVGALSVTACGDDGSSDGGEEGSGGGGSEGAQAFCDDLQAFEDKHGTGGPIQGNDLRLDEEWMEDFEAITPADEVTDAWQAQLDSFAAYEDALADVDVDDLMDRMQAMESSEEEVDQGEAQAIMSEAGEAMEVLQSEEYVDATNRLNDFTNEECDLSVD